jgi:hypothetical protein
MPFRQAAAGNSSARELAPGCKSSSAGEAVFRRRAPKNLGIVRSTEVVNGARLILSTEAVERTAARTKSGTGAEKRT